MICKKCSTENPDGAVFCQICGKRLDGKVICPQCSAINNDEANFCIQCGAKLNNKSVCSACGAIYEGNYCPTCGYASSTNKPQRSMASAVGGWRRIVEYVGGGLAMTAVFFALLFTFFIGVQLSISGDSSDSLTQLSAIGLYDYFGPVYSNLANIIDVAKTDGTKLEAGVVFTLLYPSIVGTLIAVAVIVTVIVFSAISISRYVKYVTGKSEKDYAGFAFAAVVAFFVGSSAFYALLSCTSVQYLSTGGESISTIVMQPATVAGIVLASLFLGLFVGCRIAINAKAKFLQKQLPMLILSAVSVVLFSIALHFVGSCIAELVSSRNGIETSHISLGYDSFAGFIFSRAEASNGTMDLSNSLMNISVITFLGLLVQLTTMILIACAIVKFLANLAYDSERGEIKYAITAAACVVLHLAFAVVTGVLYLETIDSQLTYSLSFTYACPITAMVFALLALGVTTAHKILLKKYMAEQLPPL